MAEIKPAPEAMVTVAPDYIGAVFETGRSAGLVYNWVAKEYLVPVLDVEKKEARDRWGLENIRVFSDGTLASPELKWKPVIDFWLTELKTAATRAGLERKELRETEWDIKAMMAVSASARAIEQSAGVAEKYATFMTVDGGLDKQDSWAEFLLHRDPGKLNRVIVNPLVKHYYERLLEDAGMTDGKEWRKVGTKWRPSSWKTKIREARRGKLVEYLKSKKEYKGGFDEYIADVLLAGDTEAFIAELIEQLGIKEEESPDTCRWAAARLACDAFLVDKFTRWEFEIDPKGKLRLKPSPGWGGDPLRAVLEPSFLPRRIKKVYQKEDEAILNMMDLAFRPQDILKGGLKKELLQASMVVHLKRYYRYSSALWTFLGSSRGIGIPQWTRETMEKNLPSVAELLDQVYGGTDKPKSNTGKHVVGAMMARILQCKALATAVESVRPGFSENIAVLFGAETARPFLEIEKLIWGPDLKAKKGFLASLAGGRTRLVFKKNDFGAERTLKDAWEILATNDQDPKGRGKAKTLNTIGFFMDVAQAIAAGGKRR